MSLGQRRNDTLDAPPPRPPPETLRSAPHPLPGALRQLARQMRLERRRAADPEELAARLEESGHTDDWLREHGLGDVFEVATRLYALKTGGPRPALAPPLEPPWPLLWRGPLLVLIGLAALSSARWLGVPEAEAAVGGAAVVAWGLGARLSARHWRPRLLTGAALGSLAGALTALGLAASLGTADLGTANLGMVDSGTVDLWRSAALGGGLGGLYGLTLTAAGLLLALDRRRVAALVFGGALLLGELLRRAVPDGWNAALAVVALLGLVAAAVGAVWWPESRVSQRPSADRQPGAGLNGARRGSGGWSGYGWTGYGWTVALALAALAWRVGTAALLWPLLSFGLLELLAWLMQARLRRLAGQFHDPARLVRAARWSVLGVPALLLLLGAAGLVAAGLGWTSFWWPGFDWTHFGWLRADGSGIGGAVPSALGRTWGSALLSVALLQSTWLARHPRQRLRLTRLWLLGAGLLAAPLVSWWAALLLLTLTLTLLSDDALSDLTTYR